MRNGNVAADHIILMAYDDIASSNMNPFPGQIFNKPTPKGVAGYDVYAGCEIAYSGDDVTAENFYAVLTGDSASVPKGKPVLGSTADDEVFVYFTDHGGTGLIAMPVGDYVYYDELNATLTTMHDKGLYSKLVFYLEACEAGSMFDGVLSPALGIAVTTASNADESSWGTYCGTDATVDGVDVGSCLGDLYSVSWMEDSDDLDQVCGEGLLAQFLRVKVETNLSHVTPFGDTSFARDTLCAYQAADCDATCDGARAPARAPPAPRSAAGSVDSRDATLHYLTSAYLLRGGSADAVAAEVRARDRADATNAAIVAALAGGEGVADTGRAHDAACLRAAVTGVEAHCGRYSDYGLKHVRTLNNLCNAGFSGAQIEEAAEAACA